MKAKIILYTNDPETKDGFPVVLSISHNTKTKRVRLNFYVPKHHWNFDKNLPLPVAECYETLYPYIMNLKSRMYDLIKLKITDLNAAADYIIEKEVAAPVTDFYKFTDTLVKEQQKVGRQANAKTYNTAIVQLKKYRPKLALVDLNHQLLNGFKLYKQADGVSKTSIHGYLRSFRAIYNEAVARGMVADAQPFKTIFKGLSVRAGRSKKKYLDIDAIYKLEKVELTGLMDKIRDMFLLQFYLGGQDLIDIYHIKRKNIRNNRIYFERKKLGDRGAEFDLGILPKTAEILKKYSADDEFLFEGRKDYAGYDTFRRRYQRYLTQLQTQLKLEVLPKGENLGIKVARHTFANRAKQLFIEEDIIRELMGHERDDVDNYYKDRYSETVRDAALLKITKTTKPKKPPKK